MVDDVARRYGHRDVSTRRRDHDRPGTPGPGPPTDGDLCGAAPVGAAFEGDPAFGDGDGDVGGVDPQIAAEDVAPHR
jgi:hypothetical protein